MKVDISTKAALVAALRKHYGYEGDGSNESVKAFIADSKNEVKLDQGFNVDEVLGKAVTIGYHADSNETVKVSKLRKPADESSDHASASDAGSALSDSNSNGLSASPVGRSASSLPLETRSAERFVKAQHEIFAPTILTSSNKSAFERIRNRGFDPLANRNAGYVGEDLDTAIVMGAALRLALTKQLRIDDYAMRAADVDICGKTLTGIVGGTGAEWVAPEFSSILIANKSRYGAARKAAGVTPMRRETLEISDVLSDVAPTWTSQGAASTAQDKPGTDRVSLVAQTLRGLVKVSREFLNDSQVDVTAAIAESYGRGMAKAEDDAFFNGDGTSTYGHFLGCRSSMGSAGTVTSTQTTLAAITDADIMSLIGTTADWVDDGNCCFVGSRNVYFSVLNRLAAQRGGVSYSEAQNGVPTLSYNGYPYYITASMPSTIPASKEVLLFGDFRKSAKFGEVIGSNQLLTSDQRYFDEANFAFLGMERVAISIHDAGDSSNAGGVSLLKTS